MTVYNHSWLRAYFRLLRCRFLHAVLPIRPSTLVVSYPKSGRTWLRVMLGYLYCDALGLPIDQTSVFKIFFQLDNTPLPRIGFTHAGTGTYKHQIIASVPFTALNNKIPFEFACNKVIFLVRDPKDILVSLYFHTVYRDQIYAGDISDFVHDERFGIEKILRFYHIWHNFKWVPLDFMVISYEEMHQDVISVLHRIIDFVEFPGITDRQILAAAQFGKFENMQKLERQSDSYHPLGTESPENPESFKVRKGKIGGYTEYLDKQDIQSIDDIMHKTGMPFRLLD